TKRGRSHSSGASGWSLYAELVVVVILNACVREIAVEGFEVLVRRRGPAMQQEHLDLRIVADAFGPDLEHALRRLNGDHTHAAAEYIVAAVVMQVRSGRWRTRRRRRAAEQRQEREDGEGEMSHFELPENIKSRGLVCGRPVQRNQSRITRHTE